MQNEGSMLIRNQIEFITASSLELSKILFACVGILGGLEKISVCNQFFLNFILFYVVNT